MNRKRSVTQGSVQRSRKRISTGNVSTSGRNVQTTNSSRTSGQLETQGFHVHFGTIVPRRYWGGCGYLQGPALLLAFELVEWIFVKHNTVLGLDISVDDTESGELAEDYWSLLSSWQDTTGSDQPRIENRREIETWKIRIYPTSKEREKLRKWMGIVRWMYNKVLETTGSLT
jgi:hypothetical protein